MFLNVGILKKFIRVILGLRNENKPRWSGIGDDKSIHFYVLPIIRIIDAHIDVLVAEHGCLRKDSEQLLEVVLLFEPDQDSFVKVTLRQEMMTLNQIFLSVKFFTHFDTNLSQTFRKYVHIYYFHGAQ